MSLINISICLSDIPKDKISTSTKNGKKYLNMVVAEKRETDQYGKTHTVYVQQSKEEQDARADKQYLGNGKIIHFNNSAPQPAPTQNQGYNPSTEEHSDLPF